MGLTTVLASLLLASSQVLGHPAGMNEKIYSHAYPRDMKHCDKKFKEEDFARRTAEIKSAELHRLRRALGVETENSSPLHKRSYISVSKIDHKSNKTLTLKSDPTDLFADAGACILMPAVDQGPLYVKGEHVRKDITEGQGGVKMTLAIQVVDVKTCEPVKDAYIDIWSSNSTGMYMGVQGYPGMGDAHDPNMLKGHAMRGIQPVDDHGIATFDTLMPGHYEGRATHIHTIVYLGATKNPNNTITGGRAAHVGQLYFDQPLITAVNKLNPYVSNTMGILENTRDFLFQMGANGDDPILRYSFVNNKLDDGMFAWIRYGVNTNNDLRVSPAAFADSTGTNTMNPTGPIAAITRMGGGFGGGGGFGMGKGKGAAKIKRALDKILGRG